jgi:hypothetical protein
MMISPVTTAQTEKVRTGNGSVDINAGGRQVTRGGGGAVHLMLSMQREHDVHGARQPGVWLVPEAEHPYFQVTGESNERTLKP